MSLDVHACGTLVLGPCLRSDDYRWTPRVSAYLDMPQKYIDCMIPCTVQTASTLTTREPAASASSANGGPLNSLQHDGIPAIFTWNLAPFICRCRCKGRLGSSRIIGMGAHQVRDCEVSLILVLPQLYVRESFLEVLIQP